MQSNRHNLRTVDRPRRTPDHDRAGFTLIETTLAMVLGSMVLAGCFGIFVAIRRMDSTFETRYLRTSELDITHTVMSRAMLGLLMDETQSNPIVRADSTSDTTTEASNAEPEPRPRMILQLDPTVAPDSSGWTPQRFEIVNATPPVPSSLATQAAGWYSANDKGDSLDFSAMDGSQGAVRGVFELRKAGQREYIMQQLGLIGANDPILEQAKPDDQPNRPLQSAQTKETKPNWTLWWRPILGYEGQQLLENPTPLSDTQGTSDEIRARLSGAIPIMRGIKRCEWKVFKGDEYVDSYAGLTMGDLPAFTQFEVFLTNSQYATWLFEVDWVLGDDPSETVIATADDPNADTNNGANGQPGTNGDSNGNGRPGGRNNGQVDPNATINLSDPP